MNLLELYQQQCQSGAIERDPEQETVLGYFQSLHDSLLDNENRKNSWLPWRKRRKVTGLYLWGGVGAGKTFLMDTFYENIPIKKKMRLHFHAFMKMVHHEMLKYRGQRNPVRLVAKALAEQYSLICFDEFYVTEVVDAMILARLLETLIDNGVCFVATSNTPPDRLYESGLQRISFLPAIKLLNEHTKVVHLQSRKDYRLMQVKKSGVFFHPDNDHARRELKGLFDMLSHGQMINEDPINIHGRWINVSKRSDDAIWLLFDDICNIPRSQQDYLALVAQYKYFFISGVPDIPDCNRNIVLLFIRFIDVLYDVRMPLFFSSDVPVASLCRDIEMFPEYARTQSRLMEMQSEKYLAERL